MWGRLLSRVVLLFVGLSRYWGCLFRWHTCNIFRDSAKRMVPKQKLGKIICGLSCFSLLLLFLLQVPQKPACPPSHHFYWVITSSRLHLVNRVALESIFLHHPTAILFKWHTRQRQRLGNVYFLQSFSPDPQQILQIFPKFGHNEIFAIFPSLFFCSSFW